MRILEDAKQKVNPKLMELFHTAPRGKGGRGRGGGGGFGGRGRGGGGSTVDYQNKTHPNYGQNSQVGLILVVCQKMPFLLSFYSFIQKLNVSNLNRKALIRNAVFRLLLLTYFFSTSFEKNFSFFIVYKCNIQSAALAGIQIY